jgi:uncharacterized protein YjbJ (UPF0337 family)
MLSDVAGKLSDKPKLLAECKDGMFAGKAQEKIGQVAGEVKDVKRAVKGRIRN